MNKQAQFLYPVSRQFPFDEVCEQIVRGLKKRNWQVPGIRVRFREYGNRGREFRTVSEVIGSDFKLYFCRVQGVASGSGGHWDNIAAVSEIIIPEKELHIHNDESGLVFYLYIGGNYERDRESFMNGIKIHSKLNNKARQYLKYEGGCNCQDTASASFELISFVMANSSEALDRMHHTHRGCRSPLLLCNNDLDREYDPKEDEPKSFRTDEVMEEFRIYLEDVVLNMI